MTLPKRFTREQVMAFVITSCATQGISLYVTDLKILRNVAVLLSMGAGAVGTATASRRSQAHRIQGTPSSNTRNAN